MTVAQLIKELECCDPEALVVSWGHSDGDNDDFFQVNVVEELYVEEERSWRGSHIRSEYDAGKPAVLVG